MVQDVIRLLSQEETMELSQKIACEVTDAICSYGKEASYVPPGLLSLAAEIFRTQRRTTQLVEVPDWTHLRNNQDMCMKYPLYSKTLGAAPPIASAASATAPVPTPAPALGPPPASTPAPAPVLAPVPDASIHMPRCATSSETALAESLKTWNHRLSTSPPVPHANWSWKPVIKSKEILSDTDTTDTEKVKVKVKALAVSSNEDADMIYVDDLPDVELKKSMHKAVIPAKKQGTLKASQLVVNEDDKEDELQEDKETQGRLKASSLFVFIFAGPSLILMQATLRPGKRQKLSIQSKGKITGRQAKAQQPPHTDGPLCQAKDMACIRTDTESATITPTTDTAPPVAAVTTRSKTTWSKATRKKMGGHLMQKKIQQPSPIKEEDNVQMLNGTVDVMGAQQQLAPLASANNFPLDHWIKPDTDESPPPAPWPQRTTSGSCHYLSFTALPPLSCLLDPVNPPGTPFLMTKWRPYRLERHMDLAEASDSAMSMQVDAIEQDMHVQCGLLSECTTKVRDIVRYLREQRFSQVTVSTPPTFNPPPITAPGPSISAFARTVTNNVFTPDVSWIDAQTSDDAFGDTADGSPVVRHN
ncbi:hypothetical protein BDR03DRAFT_1004514 [Suillus americanus]|nr:hypothetical protein BDR03DRAFT_1004514 [Suillus americanus]